MLTAVEACSQALVAIGAQPVVSLNEPTIESRTAAAVYQRTRKALLSSDEWTFARAYSQPAPLASTPVDGWKYAYPLPQDYLRLLAVLKDGVQISFAEIGDQIRCDETGILISYIADVDEAVTPGWWDAVLVLMLASEMAIPLTESATKRRELASDAARALIGAKAIDRHQTARQAPLSSSFVAARWSSVA